MSMTEAEISDPTPRDEMLNMVNCSLLIINPVVKDKNDQDLTKEWTRRRRIIKTIARIVKNSNSDEE